MRRWIIRLILFMLSSLCFALTAQAAGADVHVPILMYHYVSELPPHADATRLKLTVSPEKFRAEMQYLSDQGYHAISLYQLYEALTHGAVLPSKPIALTFDDGYEDAYTNVLPILRSFGFKATFFIITDPVDAGNPAYLSWGQVQQMVSAGMSMEAHTRTHADLRQRSQPFLMNEIQGSLDDIKAHIGQQPHMFAYPSGRYDAETLKVMHSLPVWIAVTTQHGALESSDQLLKMPRIRVASNTSLAGFARLLGDHPA